MFESSQRIAPAPSSVPGDVHAAMSAAAAALEAISATASASAGWSGSERAAVLAGLDRLTARLTTARARWLLAERDAGTSVRTGDPDFAAAVARRTRSGHGIAARQVQQADALAVLPAVANAVDAGSVPVAHLDPLARAVATASPTVRGALTSEEGQSHVVALARRHDAPTFGRELARWAATLDPAALERDHQTQRRNRYLHLSDQPDGTRISGLLDRMAGHRLRIALEATGERPGEDRAPEQARADALLVLAEHALAEPSTQPGAAVRPHVSLVLTEDAYAQLRTATASEGTAPVSAAPAATAPPATLDDGTPVPMSEVARILCDCELTRVVVNAEGTPVNLGRTRRLYTGPQRRAVIVRDRTCAFGDCGRPARWCEVHHIRWWDRDLGPTSVDNAILLCTFHHHEVHRHDLTIRRLRPDPPGASGVSTGGHPRATYSFTTRDGRVVAGPRPGASARTGPDAPLRGSMPDFAADPPPPPNRSLPSRRSPRHGPAPTSPPAAPPGSRRRTGPPSHANGEPDLFAVANASNAPPW